MKEPKTVAYKREGLRLPFVIGQKAEALSFQQGFRGAWFRCEVKEISHRKGEIGAVLAYFDFPDEKHRWLKLYQFPVGYGAKSKERRRQLMLRPEYPPIYHNNQTPDVNAVSEVIVVVDGVWKVGDLVDWWTDNSYWSGSVTEILDDEKARIALLPPPMGEGLSYEVFLKDLRPSLEWSLDLGWTVPLSKDGREPRHCVQLIRPVKQGSEKPSLPLSTTHPKELIEASATTKQYIPSNAIGETSSSGRDAASHIGDTSTETAEQTAEDPYDSGCPLKKFKSSGGVTVHSHPLEAAILDLEELVNKVKWLKRILECGTPMSNAVRPSWEFVEHRGSSMPR